MHAQLSGQRQRRLVQLTVSHLPLLVDNRHGLRIAPRMLHEILLQAAFKRIAEGGSGRQRLALRLQADVFQRPVVVVSHLLQYGEIVAGQPIHRRLAEQRRSEVEARTHLLALRRQRERQVELGGALISAQIDHRQPVRARLRAALALQREHDLEQRMARKIARQRQIVHQRFQRQRLMLLRLQRRGRHLPHKLGDAMTRIEPLA